MFRDMFISTAGHVLVIAGVYLTTVFGHRPPKPVRIVPITAVSPQQIQRLLQESAPRERTTEKVVPQVQVKKDEVLPRETRRKKQTLKRETTQSQQSPAKSTKKKGAQQIDGIDTDTPFDYPDYLIAMRDKIVRNWRYPVSQESLVTVVYFRIKRDGTIETVRIKDSSKNLPFDRAAFKAVKDSGPFDPLPGEFKSDDLGVSFQFIYEAGY